MTIGVPIHGGTSRNDLSRKLQHNQIPDGRRQQLVAGNWRLNGLPVGELRQSAASIDSTWRLHYPGLLGGRPPKKRGYQDMVLMELSEACKGTPVPRSKRAATGEHKEKTARELAEA